MRTMGLDDGHFLQEAINQFYENSNNESFIYVLRVLRDCIVYIPTNIDQDDWMELSVLSNEMGSFLAVFSTKEEMEKEYREEEFGCMHFMEVMYHVLNEDSIDGILLDVSGKTVKIHKDDFEEVMAQMPIMESEDYTNPVLSWLQKGNEAYQKNTKEGFKEAEMWYLKAASLYDGQAMCNLGYIYTYGRVGKPDRELGWYYFEEAAKQNNVDGLMKLADGYRYGEFIEKDETAAFSIYLHLYEVIESHSLLEEYPELLLRLGECYFYGIGVKKDYPNAMNFLGYAYSLFNRKSNEVFYYEKLKEKTNALLDEAMHFIHTEFIFKNIKDGSFRDFYLRVIYIETDTIDGTLCFGYVDHEKGLCFRGIYRCLINDSKKEFYEKTDVVYTYEQIQDGYYLDMRQRIDTEEMVEEIIEISKEYYGKSSLDLMRMATLLDNFRNPVRPDEFLVGIVVNDKELEKIWVRCESVEEGCMTGIVLEEPKTDCQIHKGSEVSILAQTDEETDEVDMSIEGNTMVS